MKRDVILGVVQSIFHMPANDAEGMTDDEGDEWLVTNDEMQGLIYLFCVILAFTTGLQTYTWYIVPTLMFAWIVL